MRWLTGGALGAIDRPDLRDLGAGSELDVVDVVVITESGPFWLRS